MTEQEFKDRTKAIAVRVIALVESLPRTRSASVIGNQLIRSGTAIGANYRAACRGISRRDLIAKLGDVEEEADETLYWMELLIATKVTSAKKLESLMDEVSQVLAMVVSSIRTARKNPK
jgi:four helix bundle protein